MSDTRTTAEMVASIRHRLRCSCIYQENGLCDPLDRAAPRPARCVRVSKAFCHRNMEDTAVLAELLARNEQLERERDQARTALIHECPRASHVTGLDPRPDTCEQVKSTAPNCNIAHGIGWDECPEYPLLSDESRGEVAP